MLNLTKEGIVVQFLPEAKDFGVSLNQAIMKIHKDCPFTEEEILTFKAMLYQVNTSHRCINPAPFSWVIGYQWWQNENLKK